MELSVMMDTSSVCAPPHSSHQFHGVAEHLKCGQDERGAEFPTVFTVTHLKLRIGATEQDRCSCLEMSIHVYPVALC